MPAGLRRRARDTARGRLARLPRSRPSRPAAPSGASRALTGSHGRSRPHRSSSLQNRAGVRSGARPSRRQALAPALPQLRPRGRGVRGAAREPAGGAMHPPFQPPP
ncbi:unnamed protein product [Coccothraustes coccothraustes]